MKKRLFKNRIISTTTNDKHCTVTTSSEVPVASSVLNKNGNIDICTDKALFIIENTLNGNDRIKILSQTIIRGYSSTQLLNISNVNKISEWLVKNKLNFENIPHGPSGSTLTL